MIYNITKHIHLKHVHCAQTLPNEKRKNLSMRWCYYMSKLWNWCKNLFLCYSHSNIIFDGFCGFAAFGFFSPAFSLSTDEANGMRIRNFNYYRMKSLMKYGTRNMFISKFHRMAMGVWGRSIANEMKRSHGKLRRWCH